MTSVIRRYSAGYSDLITPELCLELKVRPQMVHRCFDMWWALKSILEEINETYDGATDSHARIPAEMVEQLRSLLEKIG